MVGQTPATIADKFIDISNEVCPMSFVLTKLAIEELADGQVLELVCGAGDPVRNISIQLKDEGHTIINVKREGEKHFRLQIRKNN
ncbi:MAG: sulfurtransferase TusA family protein [Nitrospinae bacterium]|nr:sulfurtransferase TusA family protein [Nitrospinota bacterium]